MPVFMQVYMPIGLSGFLHVHQRHLYIVQLPSRVYNIVHYANDWTKSDLVSIIEYSQVSTCNCKINAFMY